MSFSKAKIQRFNEVTSEAPPPGTYDPIFGNGIKGLATDKTERLCDKRSVCSAGADVECNSVRSRAISPIFITPQPIRKRMIDKSTNSTKVKNGPKTKPVTSMKNRKLEYESKHKLADLQVECMNKGKTIQEHEKYIEEMKEEIRKLELEREELCKKQTEVEEQHRKDIETMAKLQEEVLNGREEKHQIEVTSLRAQLLEVSEEKEREILARETMLSDLRDRIAELQKRIASLEEELVKKEANELLIKERLDETHKELEDANRKYVQAINKHKKDVEALHKLHEEEKVELERLFAESNEGYLKQLENLTLARNKEITEVKEASARKIEEETKKMRERADKMVENAEAVTRETLAACRAESEERVKRVIIESDAKVNAMIREAKSAVEEEMRLRAESYKACLSRVESERAMLVEKLAQRDAEIDRLSATIEELKTSAQTQESFSQSLQIELDKVETELAEKKEELRALKEQIRVEAAEMVARKRRFELIMTKNQASVAALTERLAQSNAEVERLEHELKRGEDTVKEHRDLLCTMRSNSQMVHDQMQVYIEQINNKRELVDQLEMGSLNEIKSMKSVFEAKIDSLNEVAAKEITRLQNKCEKTTSENTEMKQQLKEMSCRLLEAEQMLLKLEERNDANMIEIARMEVVNNKLSAQLNNEKKVSEDQTSFEQERAMWKTIEKTLLETLEGERRSREAAELEVKKLGEQNERLSKDYEEMNEKYGQPMDHQNCKQRVKHVSQLKDKIVKLEQELQAKVGQIKQQQKIIEKLKVDNARVHGKGKENVISHSKSNNCVTPTSSPHKPLTPLRDRNAE